MKWLKCNPAYSDLVHAPEEMLDKLDEFTY